MLNDINNLDTEDIGLKAIFGDRFHDETAEKPTAAQEKKKPAYTTDAAKAAQKPVNKPTKAISASDADWQPVKPEPDWMDNLKSCVKWVALFAGLSILFFYWQQTGQMAPTAALPSMLACTAAAGWSVGRFARGNR